MNPNVIFPPDYVYDPLYEWPGPVEFDIFWLVFPTFGPFTAALAQTQVVNIPNDADFEMRDLVYHADLAAAAFVSAAQPIPNITCMIADSGSGRNLMNAPAPLDSIAHTGFSPRIMPWIKIFTRNSQISITLTNFDAGATTENIRLVMAGRKIFSMGG